jgi:DNA gyrase/topoisomerase IV subunit A
MSYDLEKINKQIESCLAGEGSFDLLRMLQAQKADILDREHFDRIQTKKDEILALQAQRLADVETQKVLEFDLTNSAMEVDRIAGILQQAREVHADINGRLLLMKFGFDNNRLTTNEKKAELDDLIKTKINGANNNE